MDELLPSLTTAQVDQKNYGLWLKSWQVGQVLRVVVTDKSPSGDLMLRVGSHQMTATADIPVQKGAVLMLEVTSLNPVPSLKIINTPVPGAVRAHPLGAQLQQLIPGQGSVTTPFATLVDPARSANILSPLGMKSDALAQLIKTLSQFETLTDVKLLKQAVSQSGIFLEAQLRHNASMLPQGDIKATLLKLLGRLNQILGTASTLGGAPGDEEALLNLKSELKGALATITLNQLAAGQVNERGGCVWLFDVPFRLGESVHGLSLRFERENSASTDQTDLQGWKILLSVSLPQLGSIEAELFMRGSQVSVVMYSERETTARLMDGQLHQLRSGLQNRGLDVSVLLCHQGSRNEGEANLQWSAFLDEKV